MKSVLCSRNPNRSVSFPINLCVLPRWQINVNVNVSCPTIPNMEALAVTKPVLSVQPASRHEA
jgi:hypothetical protein